MRVSSFHSVKLRSCIMIGISHAPRSGQSFRVGINTYEHHLLTPSSSPHNNTDGNAHYKACLQARTQPCSLRKRCPKDASVEHGASSRPFREVLQPQTRYMLGLKVCLAWSTKAQVGDLGTDSRLSQRRARVDLAFLLFQYLSQLYT